MPLTVSGHRVLLPGSTEPRPATLTVEDGKILAVDDGWRVSDVDAGDYVLIPGLVDAHVHLNEPGRTHWEGFATGTRAASAGGVTCVVDMPLNSLPPTTTVGNLELKRDAANGQCFTDVAFWGGVIPGNHVHLKPLVDAGVKGFKCFLIESGVEEFPCVTEGDVRLAMEAIKDVPTVLLFHAELDNTPAPSPQPPHSSTAYSTFLESRPEKLEVDAISLITRLQQQFPALRCHIVHLSAASALPVIRAAKSSGLKLTVETCFHYLCLAANNLPDGHPEFKCCPPIRDDANRQLLWDALLDDTIDCVVSDHSPCIAELKKLDEGDIMGAWGGISTLGLGLSLLWTEGSKRGVTLARILEWTSKKTAEHAGLTHRKGQLAVTKAALHFKNKLSAYEGLTLRGRVQKTYVRGSLVYDATATEKFASAPVGILL
uniref:allantoinase n=1 Tax=Mycena chlorophos TaxID=658473 RepID=A0ABQ0M0L2_MYCCL|nr:allantoinase [Mycena chlorophos]